MTNPVQGSKFDVQGSTVSALGRWIGRHQVATAFPANPLDEATSRGVLAGLLAASQALLTPSDFDRLVAECEIDRANLDSLLALAAADPSDSSSPSYSPIEI